MNRRRSLLVLLGAAAVGPRAVLGQAQRPVMIGWLSVGSREMYGPTFAALKEGLAAFGWKEGSQIVFEERWGDGRYERFRPLGKELAAKNPALIVAGGLGAAIETAKVAPKIPIVMVSGTDPIAAGVAPSLRRPGGMITGVTGMQLDVTEKYLELLVAVAPTVKRVGFLAFAHNPNRARTIEAARRSAARRSVEARFAEAANPEDIEPALSRLAKEGTQALVVLSGALLTTQRRRIVEFALAQRWPVVGGPHEYTVEGALLSYGVDRLANYRRAAYYVDRILKGAKPGDLPIEQPTELKLVINMKTANALGLTIPPSILVRADEIIE